MFHRPRSRAPGGARRRASPEAPALGVPLAMLLPLLALALLSLPPLVPAPAAKATDLFVSNCSMIPDPPPNDFLKWSDPGTWSALGFTGVPGVGALATANVTIPCGMAVLLDSAVPMLNLTVLQIQGFLKVEDPATPVVYRVFACFVMVEGQLTIGSATNQFKSKITFTLMPNPNNRLPWAGSFVWPAEPAFPRSMGHKPFAVMGGQVRLHGMPGGAATPSWVKLNVSARVGDFQIVVDTDVSRLWPVGSRIAVASTEFSPDQAEPFTIIGYDTDPQGTIITLNTRVNFNHYGNAFGIPDGFGGFIDERAEVALLSRNIVITGLDEPGTFLLEGGHFIVFMTPTPQFIEGVEFFQMGQQGILGRYNIHFHVCGDDGGKSVIRKNAMHNSKQRCVVVHATHNLTIDSNVAFNTSGHCYILEEGGEMGNTFINNLGIWQRSVVQRIASDESDNSPSTFWITNMNNNFINNVAAGSDNSGFWTELKGQVRGMSLSIPKLAGLIPSWTSLGTYTGNVAHSNRNTGWQFYPNGVNPRLIFDLNANTTLSQWQWPQVPGYMYNFTTYKHNWNGVFMHNSQGIFLVNMTAADNQWGIEFNTNQGGGVVGSRFLALSNNVGTPNSYWCSGQDQNWPLACGPVVGCSLTPDPRNWRARNWNHWRNPMFGIAHDGSNIWSNGAYSAYNFTFNKFAGYDPQCGRVSAGIGTGVNGNSRGWSTAAQLVQGIQSFPSTAPPYWFAPTGWAWPVVSGTPNTVSYFDTQHNWAVWDRDGSVVGSTGGYIISANPGLLPPLSRFTCTPRPDMNAFLCPNTCYRTLQFMYNEDGYAPLQNGQVRNRSDVSYIVIRRVEDNVTHIFDGNGNSTDNQGTWRTFWVNLFAPATYEVSIAIPSSRFFWPSNITVAVQDGNGCGAPVTLRFLSIPSNQWAISTDSAVYWSQCPGTTFTGNSAAWPVQYQYVCHKQRQVLQLTILPNFNWRQNQNIFLFNSGQRVMPCRLPLRCGVWTTSDWYFYNASGRELRPWQPGAMGYAVPGFNHSSWTYGQAIIGNAGWNWDQIRATTPMMNSTLGYTHYFRKSFTVSNSACYSGIFLDIIPYQGLMAFLNNVEIFRWNLPAGNVTNNTLSAMNPNWPNPFMNTTFINITATNASFVEGTNWLAFENHAVGWWTTSAYFDSRVSLLSNSGACTGASIMPEVCDGLDNNFDGLVDIDPATGRVLARPCWTRCGTGIETCIKGAFQNCTAPPSLPETCNGRDDNCDGLIDNGLQGSQLNCASGRVCYQGQCLVQGPLTVPQPLINRSTAGWYYLDAGWPWQSYPNWNNGRFSSNPNDTTVRQFKEGVAGFGTTTNIQNDKVNYNTTLKQQTNGDIYYYYLRNFTLTAAEAANTWSLSLQVRRDQAAVIWSNGVEVMRSNFPATFNPSVDKLVEPIVGTVNNRFWPNSPLRSTGVSAGTVKAGTNWIAAQVGNYQWGTQWSSFDLEVVRNANQSCAALPGAPTACVRFPPNDTMWFDFGANWKFLDLNYTLPPNSWIERTFDDSAWPSGNAPLGVQSWTATRLNMNKTMRQAYYFRKTFTVADASCHYNYTFQLKALDGAVVYVNGVEAFRFQWEPQWVQPTDFANTYWPPTDKQTFTLSTGWLTNGNNVIAAEIHPSTQNTNNWYFDLALTGRREGVNCQPLPL